MIGIGSFTRVGDERVPSDVIFAVSSLQYIKGRST